MFTGIIEEVGVVHAVLRGGKAIALEIRAKRVLEGMKFGDSISIDGVCLTVAILHSEGFSVDVMPETMTRTTFHRLNTGSRVNLERALRLSDRLGGHIVSGHIDGTGRIVERRREENAEWFQIETSPEILRYIVPKGSVAIDGVSLTVIGVGPRTFSVGMIPVTQQETTILARQTGSDVNIECDIIGKYIEKLAGGRGHGSGVNLDTLAKNGFI